MIAPLQGGGLHWPLEVTMVNGTLTRFFPLLGGTPQGLEPSPFYFNMGSDGLSGLLMAAGVAGITVRVAEDSTTHYASTRFADD